MKRQPAIQLSIPDPCTQSWDDMQLVAGGRHCDHCQKTVVDFTRMADKQLLDYFRSAGPNTCGHFTSFQVDRLLKDVEVPKKKWLQRMAAGILLVLGLSKEATAQSKTNYQQSDHPFSITDQASTANRDESDNHDGQFKVHCHLVDEKGNAIINANVQLFEVGNVRAAGVTDFDGACDLIIPFSSGRIFYDVRFSYLGEDVKIDHIANAQHVINVNARLIQKNEHQIIQNHIMGGAVPIIDHSPRKKDK